LISESEENRGSRQDDAEWVALLPALENRGLWNDLVGVHYYLEEMDDGSAMNLVRTENRNLLATETDEDDLEEVVILEDVQAFELNWYDGSDWVESWDSTVQENQLPQAVQVRIEFSDDTGLVPLTLTVPFPAYAAATAGDDDTTSTVSGGTASAGGTTGGGPPNGGGGAPGPGGAQP
jgi:hypothetical protein